MPEEFKLPDLRIRLKFEDGQEIILDHDLSLDIIALSLVTGREPVEIVNKALIGFFKSKAVQGDVDPKTN